MPNAYKPLTLTPINFSLTEGTSIPAPPDSPPESPRPPTPGKGPLSSHPGPQNGQHNATNGHGADHGRSSDVASTMSPTSPLSKRPSSVRKFLGLRTLSSSDSLRSERPGSPATLNSQSGLMRRKSGNWFGKRKSFAVETVPEGKENAAARLNGRSVSQPAQPAKRRGPPPPALPELNTFGVSAESLRMGADDMFKNIK